MWSTKIGGVSVGGRSVYYSENDTLKIGYSGVEVPKDEFLKDVSDDVSNRIMLAIPIIVKHHQPASPPPVDEGAVSPSLLPSPALQDYQQYQDDGDRGAD